MRGDARAVFLAAPRSGFGWKRPGLPNLERSVPGGKLHISVARPHPSTWLGRFCFREAEQQEVRRPPPTRKRAMTLLDKFGRQISDLRISITDRCNFRCVYCRSADPENYRDHDEILSWPELDRLAQIFLSLGIRKIRITGGEPLVRDGVEDYIGRLHALGVEDLSMTTNGHLLAERCERLIEAGLGRINI